MLIICRLFDSLPRSLLVLRHVPEQKPGTADACKPNESDAESISQLIVWRILVRERIHADEAAQVADADLPRTSDRPPRVSCEIGLVPANDERAGAVGAHARKRQARILDVCLVVDTEQDRVPDDGQGQGRHAEGIPMSRLVAEVRDDVREHKHCRPRRYGHELCLDGRVAEGLDDGSTEIGECVGGNDASEIGAHAEIVFVVAEEGDEVGSGDMSFESRAHGVGGKAGFDKGLFGGAQPAGIFGEVGDYEEPIVVGSLVIVAGKGAVGLRQDVGILTRL